MNKNLLSLSFWIMLGAERMTAVISPNAQLVYVSTAVSQSGRLDAVMVLGTNFRMVRALIESLGYRPALLQLVKMFRPVAMSAVALLPVALKRGWSRLFA